MGILDKLIGASDEYQSTEREVIEAFSEGRIRFTDLYPVLEYENGIYLTKSGLGFILQLAIPPYLGDEDEEVFDALVSRPYPDGTVMGCFSFADDNVKPFLDYWLSLHQHEPKVDRPEVLKEVVYNRYEYYLKASEKGFWPGAKPRIFKNFLWFFFPFKKDTSPEELLRHVKEEKTKVEGVLRKYAPQDVPPVALVTTLRSVFSPRFRGVVSAENFNVNAQVLEGDVTLRIEGGEGDADLAVVKKGKKKLWRGFHVDVFPRTMTLFRFSNLFFPYNSPEVSTLLPEPFIFALVVRFRDPARRKQVIRLKAAEAIRGAENNPLVKFFPSIGEKAEEAKYVLELIEDGKLPLEASLFFFLSGESKESLERTSSAFASELVKAGFEVSREIDVALINSFFECLPLGTIPERNDLFMRYSTLFSANVASLIPFVGQVGSHEEPINLYVDRKGGLFGFNRFVSKTNYNEITVAESGGGKSFSKGDDQLLSLSYGCVVRVIDKGRSYEPLCRLVGGEFIDFREEDKPCLNPFTNVVEKDGEIHEDELAYLTLLIGILAGYDLSLSDLSKEGQDERAIVASLIMQAIKNAWKLKGRKMGVRDVYEQLLGMEDLSGENRPQKIAQALYPFAEGPFAHYFNGENTVNYSKDYVVLEIENLASKEPRLFAAVLTTLMMQVLREFMLMKKQEDEGKAKPRKKILYVDEAWEIMKIESMARFMESAARVFRKYDASLEVISQSYEDFLKGETQRAIFNNSAHLFALYPKKSDLYKAFKEGSLPFNEFQVELVASLTTVPGKFSEFYLKSNTLEGVGRLVVDPFSYWVFTTKGTERVKRGRAIRKMGTLNGLRLVAGVLSPADWLYEKGKLKEKQRLAVLRLMNDPLWRGKTEEEVLLELGIVSKEELERAKEEVERLREEALNA